MILWPADYIQWNMTFCQMTVLSSNYGKNATVSGALLHTAGVRLEIPPVAEYIKFRREDSADSFSRGDISVLSEPQMDANAWRAACVHNSITLNVLLFGPHTSPSIAQCTWTRALCRHEQYALVEFNKLSVETCTLLFSNWSHESA